MGLLDRFMDIMKLNDDEDYDDDSYGFWFIFLTSYIS